MGHLPPPEHLSTERVTQVFVESAVKRGKEDKDSYLVQYVRGVFKQLGISIECVVPSGSPSKPKGWVGQVLVFLATS